MFVCCLLFVSVLYVVDLLLVFEFVCVVVCCCRFNDLLGMDAAALLQLVCVCVFTFYHKNDHNDYNTDKTDHDRDDV